MDLLETLSAARTGISLMEISAQTGLNISTCHHLLATLANRGYVIQDVRTKHYLLGNRILELQVGRGQQIDLIAEAGEVLRRLNEETREAVHLAVLQGGELFTLAKLDAFHAVKVDTGFIGKSNAAHATATGKAILAYLPAAKVEEINRSKGLARFTERTILEKEQLLEELSRVRQLGYAVDNEEFQPGVFCVGAPVRDHSGEVIASISCSVPLMRVPMVRITEPTCSAAVRLSGRLGYSGA
jgi:IclR family acetate operon transcriptional repressor